MEMLEHEKDFVREAALDVLVDLLGSFEPDAGFRTIYNSTGMEVSLNTVLRNAVAGFRPQIKLLTAGVTKASREHKLLVDLVSLLE